MAERRIADDDLERWVAQGIISADQRQAIEQDLEQHPRDAGGLNVTTLLFYSGGLLILVAYSIFLGFQWEAVNSAGRIAIAAASLAFFAVVSQVLLSQRRFRLPGELLQVVAVAVVPLLTFALLDVIGWWPHEPGRYTQAAWEAYQSDLTVARMALSLPAVLVAGLAFWQSRSPYVLIAALIGIFTFALDASYTARPDPRNYDWGTGQGLVIGGLGLVVLASGVLVRGKTERDYSFWLYLLGIAGLATGLGTIAFPPDANWAWGVLWLGCALALLAASVPLQERLFAAAGLVAIFAYLGKLVFDVFESANAALAMILLGVLVLGAGVLYQRLTERVAARPSS
jgi:hypothetical protein